MATKLQLYNKALLYCEDRALGAVDEARGARRLLDHVYDTGGIESCLEEGLWKFATRSVKLDFDTNLTREFGFLHGFSKPTDWVKTVRMCTDEYFDQPLLDYHHEAGYWYCDLTEIYVSYVSNDTLYGLAIGDWPKSFLNFVAAHFANEIIGKLAGGNTTLVTKVAEIYKENKKDAKGNDAWNQPTAFPAPGNWSSSRRRGRSTWRDGGSRGSLIG